MHFEYFSPDVPVKVRKPTAHEMEVFIHHASELTRFGMVPYFAPIINEIRVVMINTDKAYVDKDWRVPSRRVASIVLTRAIRPLRCSVKSCASLSSSTTVLLRT